MIGATSLGALPFLREYTSHRVSSYDKTGGNADSWRIEGGETRVLAEIDGPGCIKHIWMAIVRTPSDDYLRRIVLRMYWDGRGEPSVECPVGDFFGLGHALRRNFVSLPLQMSPREGRGFNSWWPMPFKKKAIVEVTNEGTEAYGHYFYVDYELYPNVQPLKGSSYFHVQWHRESDTKGWMCEEGLSREQAGGDPRLLNVTGKDNYVILDAKGNGIYCGAHLDIDCFRPNPNDWYGEGDDMIFIDRERWPPSLHGTGTEDWYNCACCPREEYNSPYHGIILYRGGEDQRWKGKQSVYRYNIEDPIRFRRSILVTVEHGHANNLSLDYSSTAYYYLTNPARGGPALPPVEQRLPRPDPQ